MTGAVPLIAGGLLAVSELAFSALQPAGHPKPRLAVRMAWAAGAGVAGVAVSALVLLAALPHVGRSVVLTAVGTAASVAAVGVLSRAIGAAR